MNCLNLYTRSNIQEPKYYSYFKKIVNANIEQIITSEK